MGVQIILICDSCGKVINKNSDKHAIVNLIYKRNSIIGISNLCNNCLLESFDINFETFDNNQINIDIHVPKDTSHVSFGANYN